MPAVDPGDGSVDVLGEEDILGCLRSDRWGDRHVELGRGDLEREHPGIGRAGDDASIGGRVIGRFEGCNPLRVGSSDSDALAIPKWTHSRKQRLCVISVPSGSVRAEAEGFRVLELHEFHEGVVKGVVID